MSDDYIVPPPPLNSNPSYESILKSIIDKQRNKDGKLEGDVQKGAPPLAQGFVRDTAEDEREADLRSFWRS